MISRSDNIQELEEVKNLLNIGDYKVLYRINYNGLRLYIKDQPFTYYSGLTGALSAATFQGSIEAHRLKSWREGMIDHLGKEGADKWLEMTADFGELVHRAVVSIKENGKIVWKEEENYAWEYFLNSFRKKEIEPNAKLIKKMVYEYLKHVGSVMQFIYERVEEIYAIETPAIWEELKIATPVDIFCSCRQTPKGEFENTTINIKTSSQIGKHQLDQVACEFVMWNDTYDQKAKNTAILRTKNWTEGKTPTYEYKYLTKQEAFEIANDSYSRLKLCLNSESTYYPSPTGKQFIGITEIGDMPEIQIVSIEEEWNNMKND